jgi:ribosomal protein L3 glutamine methyltransferase
LAGQDGLDLVRKMLAQAADYLTEDGLIVIEVGNSEWAMRQNFNTLIFTGYSSKKAVQVFLL